MTLGQVSNFSWKTSTSSGIYKSPRIKNNSPYSGKFVAFLGILMTSVVLSVVGLLIYDITSASTTKPSTKTKRNIVFPEKMSASKLISHKEASDVNIIPEKINLNSGNRKISEHPNHRYTETEEKITSDLYSGDGWLPKPFPANKKILISPAKSGNGIPELEKRRRRKMASPVRVKGIYIEPETEVEDQSSDYSQNYYNLKQINELMWNDLNKNSEIHRDFGRPFQLPKKNPESFRQQEIDSLFKDYYPKGKIQKTKGKPITILLDIYPMTDAKDEVKKSKFRLNNKFHSGMKHFPKRKQYPRSFDPDYTSPDNIPFGSGKGNRMIIKLNLFQKKKNPRFNIGEESGQRAEERFFSLFKKFKKKKKHPKKCSVVEVYAHESPYVAKWKSKDGDWIYTKHVGVKHFKNK